MKYLKTFESENTIYQVGDYVMIYTKKIERNIDSDYDNSYDSYKLILLPVQIRRYLYSIDNNYKNNIAKIIEIDTKYPTKYYELEFYNGRTWTIVENEIKRKLTTKEIKKYEAQKAAQKYNIL